MKGLLKTENYKFSGKSLETAEEDFGWGPDDIINCLKKLNGRHYVDDPVHNHYFKTDPHHTDRKITKMDIYKAREIMEGFSIYTHFCIDPSDDFLDISSFHKL